MASTSRRKQPSIECNQELVELLLQIGDYEKNVNRSVVKYNAYRKAANAIGKLDAPVKSGDDAQRLPGVGKKIAQKIDQYLQNGRIDKLDKIRRDPKTEAIGELTRVTGIGPAHAAKLLEQGIDSIDKLRKYPEHLTHHQKVGLKHVDDFEKRIPRDEIAQFEEILTAAAASVSGDMLATVCGSYRRGAASSGDVDALVTEPSLLSTDKGYKRKAGRLLAELVEELRERGVVTDTLSHGDTKFMGVAVLPDVSQSSSEEVTETTESESAVVPTKRSRVSDEDTASSSAPVASDSVVTSESEANSAGPIFRRIDIKMSPSDQYAFGTLHFTGSDQFNRQMRATTLEAGFTLNEYSIRPVGSTGLPGEPVEAETERDIFDVIGMKYVPPDKRSW